MEIHVWLIIATSLTVFFGLPYAALLRPLQNLTVTQLNKLFALFEEHVQPIEAPFIGHGDGEQ